ncbi:bacteriocin [Streptomyces angustmyceticus]|uniref:bacteriocin n=1 Tax=Streptomyces angustmyceticus TaxID=285578 RepID=UPI0021AFC447|nr:bacteriocin [Streptomyces angustmyceticus]
MRNDFTPATEISDSELENISGGIAGGAGTGAEIAGHGTSVNVGGFVGAGASISPEGVSAQVAGSALASVHTAGL